MAAPDFHTPDSDAPLVVITGGTGLIGSGVTRRLVTDYRVVTLDRSCDPKSPTAAEVICTDLASTRSVDRAVDRIRAVYGSEVASIVHLAAYYDFSGADSPLYEDVTIKGTQRLLAATEPLQVEQVVFSSTMLVHVPTEPGDPIGEDDPIAATWPYPESKVVTEDVVEDATTGGTKSVIVRIAGVYDEYGHSPPITNQIKRIDGDWFTSHFYPADLDRGQAFVHRDDVVDALVRIVDRRRELPDDLDLLIAEPETLGYGDLQDLIGRSLHGHDWTTMEIPEELATIGAWLREKNPFGEDPFIRSWMIEHAEDHYEIDIGRARRLLDWEPEHRVAEVIPEMVEHLRSDRAGWYAANELEPPDSSAAGS